MIIFAIIFLLSRFYTANINPVWFDSAEYLTRFANPNFWTALSSGHYPLHAGYILLFKNLPLISSQIILGLAGLIAFYKLTKSKTATIIASLLPIVWISQTTVMMEAAYVPLFLISLYFFKNKKCLLASVFFSLSLLTHLAVLLWIPLVLYYNKKSFIYLFVSILITSLFNAYLISPNILTGLAGIYLSKTGEHVQLTNIFVLFRNFFIPLLRNNTSLIVILAGVSIFINRKSFILNFLWIAPAIITNQWWDSLLFGRHALIASFGLALAVSQLLKSHRLLKSFVVTYLILVTLPTVDLINKPIPYLEVAKQIKGLQVGGTLIDSHFARPQTTNIYPGKTIYVNEPGWKFEISKPLFVTSAALSDPYGLYTGPYLHSLSLSYKENSTLYNYLKNESFKKVSKDIYEVVETGVPYPKINLYYSDKRLDYYDPISQLWIKVVGNNNFFHNLY